MNRRQNRMQPLTSHLLHRYLPTHAYDHDVCAILAHDRDASYHPHCHACDKREQDRERDCNALAQAVSAAGSPPMPKTNRRIKSPNFSLWRWENAQYLLAGCSLLDARVGLMCPKRLRRKRPVCPYNRSLYEIDYKKFRYRLFFSICSRRTNVNQLVLRQRIFGDNFRSAGYNRFKPKV